MSTLTAAAVLELALAAGFSRADADVMVVIAKFESGWNPNNNGDQSLSRYGSVGLWQIFTGAHTPSEFGLGTSGWNKPLIAQLYVPATNAHAALVIFKEQGFGAWSTYNAYHGTSAWSDLLKQVQAIKAVGGTKPAPVVAKPTPGYLASLGNTNADAIAGLEYAKAAVASGKADWHDLCAAFVRSGYRISAASWGSHARTAASAAHWAAPLHTWYTAPAGCPVFWTGGATGAGHVALADGHGNIYTNDFGPNGYIGDGRIHLIPQSAVQKHDPSLKYAGWGETFLGVRVYNG